MNVFQFNAYQDVLNAQIHENRKIYGYKAKLADAAGCQRPYISQVLGGRAHLTPEHALKLCRFWTLSNTETQYFLNLVARDRAGTKGLKEYHDKMLLSLREDVESLAKRYEEKDIPKEDQWVYYSDWVYSAIHILVTIPKYQSVPSIAERLSLPQNLALQTLKRLKELGLVIDRAGKWQCTKKAMHISKNSFFNALNHQNWRTRAVLDAASPENKSVHYTAVYSMSLKDFAKFQQMLLEFMDKTRDLVRPSPEEELVCFNCDLFKV